MAMPIVPARLAAQAGQFDHLHKRGETLSGRPTAAGKPDAVPYPMPIGIYANNRS
jgi:hypothetical protein